MHDAQLVVAFLERRPSPLALAPDSIDRRLQGLDRGCGRQWMGVGKTLADTRHEACRLFIRQRLAELGRHRAQETAPLPGTGTVAVTIEQLCRIHRITPLCITPSCTGTLPTQTIPPSLANHKNNCGLDHTFISDP